MFIEELGIATTSRWEQHKVQYFQQDTKTRFVFYKFFCTCGFSTFSIWVEVYEIFALTTFKVHQCLDGAWCNDCVWWNGCCWRTIPLIFARMQIHFFRRFSFFSLVTKNDNWLGCLSSSFFSFFFAPRKEDDELVLVVVFFCFVFSELEKMTTI
jgi:hypothetical protein